MRLCPRCDSGIFKCGLDSVNSGRDRSSFTIGWLFIYASTSIDFASVGVYNLRVSSSDGGLRMTLAAVKAG